MNQSQQHGFTLVELGIVLMIIGLLIGGILRGQELLKNAQISATIQQVKAYQGAYTSFLDAYSNLPGDMSAATARLPGCTPTNSCQNGDGNGIIGPVIVGWGSTGDGDSSITGENTQIWKHLALAHLITGVNPSASIPAWGQTHPVAKISGGFFAETIVQDGGRQGLQFRLQGQVSGSYLPSGLNPLSPREGGLIDRKMDDGMPITGSVTAYGANSECRATYNESVDLKDCIMGFNM